jgi:DNA-binding response OmpR family regulator
MMDKVLVLSEDETACGLLGMILQRECFLPILANSREVALQNICTLAPDVLIINLPVQGMSSVEVCNELRTCQNKPIIVVSDSSEEIDKVLALEAGADDYIPRPFAPRELVARVRAVLRRSRRNPAAVIQFGSVTVDRERRTVKCGAEEVRMTPCEYNLLLFFIHNVDLALTRHTILSSVWGYSDDAATRTLDAHVSKLRKKCEPNPNTPRHFLTIRGFGYRFLM